MALGFTKRNGGDVVPPGVYWNLDHWEAQVVPPPGCALKGVPSMRYVRLPLLALLVLAPLMGAVYAFFLPFIGFAMVIAYLVRWLGRTIGAAFKRPLESHQHAGRTE